MAKLQFDANRFGDLMLSRGDIFFEDGDKHDHGWTQRKSDGVGMAMHYRSSAHHDYYYRTWRHDVSLCRAGTAILVSSKIDQRRSAVEHDDHLILLASVAYNTTTITVQAAMQSIWHKVSGQTDLIVHQDNVGTDIALENAVTACIDKMMKDANKGKDGGYSFLATIAKINLQSLAASCVMK